MKLKLTFSRIIEALCYIDYTNNSSRKCSSKDQNSKGEIIVKHGDCSALTYLQIFLQTCNETIKCRFKHLKFRQIHWP